MIRERASPEVTDVVAADLPAIRALIGAAIRRSVAKSEEEASFLVSDVGKSLDWWGQHGDRALHLKVVRAGTPAGVILVKDFWNLTNLFVAPGHQAQGIGRTLLTHVLEACRGRSPRGALQVNSSTNAVGFYEHMGFRHSGPARNLPGGCIPMSFDF